VILLRVLSTFALLCGMTVAAFSQAPASAAPATSASDTATLSGIVSDKTGAVVQGAAISLSDAKGTKKDATSDEKGSYSFSGLAPGTYTLVVTAPNFAPYTAADINLTAGTDVPLDATLEAKSESQKVEVEGGSAGKVETGASNIEGTITAPEVVKAPLNGRNFSQLIALAPGVSNQTGQDEAKVGVVGSVKYSVNGGRVEYNTFEVDGADVLNTGINGAASTLIVYPSLDAINEVKVLTSNYGAQYGRTASGTVVVTTKSGENFGGKYHGAAYEFLRNEFFNSRNYFDQGAHAPLYRRHDFGGTFGGPLTIPGVYNTKKDKTFFFFSEEFRLEKTPTDFNQAVPSLAERAGDFSDVCPPTTTQPGESNTNPIDRKRFPDCPVTTGTQYPGGNQLVQPGAPGVASFSGIDNNARILLASNLIPLPTSNTGCNSTIGSCYNTTVSPSTYWREELVRIDHHFTAKAQVTARYIHDSWDTTVLTPQWGTVRNSFPTVENRFVGPGTSMIVHLTNTITPTLINEFVVSYGNSHISLANRNGPGGAQYQRNPLLDQPLVPDPSNPNPSVCNVALSIDPVTHIPQCQIGYLFNNGFGGKFPGVVIGGTNGAYGGHGIAVDPSYTPWTHTNPTFSLRDDVLKSIGHHTIQVGAQFILSQRNQDSNAIGGATGDLQGLLTFSNVNGGFGDTGNAFANFLIQNPNRVTNGASVSPIQSFTQDSSQGRYHQTYQIAEPYFQDDWQVTKRLTLNIGLRMSFFGNFEEKNHRAYNFVPSAFNQSLASQVTIDPATGVLLDTASGQPIPFNPSQFGPQDLDPRLTNGLVQCGVRGVAPGCMTSHLINPAPRIGFAWDPFGDHKTSIRGGYGIFFEHGTGNEANTGSLEASSPLVLSMTQRFPQGYGCIGNIGGGNNTNCFGSIGAYPLNITAIPTRTVWPYAQQWSFSVQRELPRDFVTSFAYVGSKGTNLTLQRQINQLSPVAAVDNPFAPGEPIIPTLALTPVKTGDCAQFSGSSFNLLNGTTVTSNNPAYRNLLAACTGALNVPDTNSLRPYPGYGLIYSLQNIADSSYHAFQTTVRHTKGPITLGVSYSYSHAIDNSSDRSDTVFVNTLDPKSNRASSNFDQRHLLNANYIYQLPVLKWANALRGWNAEAAPGDDTPGVSSDLAKRLLEGWELSGITTFQSGTPFSVINGGGNTGIAVADNAGLANGAGPASYADVISGQPKPGGGSNAESFGPLLGNPAQFVAPRGLTFGNAGRNFLNNPSRLNFDMTLLKHFKLREGTDLEFRAEAFNIFNHTQFRIYDPDNPGSSGNNVISCYGGPLNSAGFQAAGGTDCLTGASFLHPINAHRPRTLQMGLKLSF
jgi:Carboxypeptidase regulatory-like domain